MTLDKHLKLLFQIFTFLIFFSLSVSAQNSATVSWKLVPPDSQRVSSISGNVTGTEATGNIMVVRDYTGTLSSGGGPLGNFQRWFINANWPDDNTQNSERYIQFSVKPDSGYGLNVSSVFMYLNAGGTSNMRANIYYSLDSSFSAPVILNKSGEILAGRDSASPYNYNIQAKVDEGGTFYVRIYPWLPGGSDNTGKYIFLQSVSISGATFVPGTATIPTVTTTNTVTQITDSSAVCGANVASDGGSAVTARGICWNTTGSPTTENNHVSEGAGTGQFSIVLSGLNPATKYFVRAYAANELGTSYGNEVTFTTADTSSQLLAFPGAEGYGRFTTGGRGGRVLEVTNLNDSGPGSLRDALDQNFPRIIVFRVSGTIFLQSVLKVKYGNLTVAGQTAPGGGICTANYTFSIEASNVIIRFIKCRLGDLKKYPDDAMHCNGTYSDIIIDHCSFSWSLDEAASFYDNHNFTLQWCIISESLYHSYHPKGNHGYGGIWGGMGATFHHNLLADNSSRNPRFCGARYHMSTASSEIVDFRNNVIFNWGFNSAYGGESGNQNMVNNYFKPGPATSSGNKQYRIVNPSDAYNQNPYSQWYVSGNYVVGDSAVSANNWDGGVQPSASTIIDSIRSYSPIPYAPVHTESAQDAYNSVLANAGCNYPRRDSADLRVINEVITGLAPYGATYAGGHKGIIDSQTDVGGWPVLESTTPPVDSDHDGMPDAWESAHGLNPNDSTDARLTAADGYTNIEDYVNSLVANQTTGVNNSVGNSVPQNFKLYQNYPNPFNPSTEIKFDIVKAGVVHLDIFNVLGEKVDELVNEYRSPGSYSINWNAKNSPHGSLPSGVYLARITQAGTSQIIKLLLLK